MDDDCMSEARDDVTYMPIEDQKAMNVAADTARSTLAMLQSDSFAQMTDRQKIDTLVGAVQFMEQDMQRMANIVSDAIDNMNKMISYIDSVESYTRRNYHDVLMQVGDVKKANKPIMIVGGKNVQENHEVDKKQEAEGLQEAVHSKDGG